MVKILLFCLPSTEAELVTKIDKTEPTNPDFNKTGIYSCNQENSNRYA